EALKLARSDVDWEHAMLTIHETKFHKSRLVPLHPTAVQALEAYARFRDRCHPIPQTDAFFVSERGTPLPDARVRITFPALRTHLPNLRVPRDVRRGSMTCGTPSRAGGCSAGMPTGRISTTPSPPCRPTWATPRSVIPSLCRLSFVH